MSATNAVTDAFVSAYKEAFPEDAVTELDISGDTLPGFAAEHARSKFTVWGAGADAADSSKLWIETKKLIKQFTDADKIVITAPMHNFQIPACLKLYLDHIVQPHL